MLRRIGVFFTAPGDNQAWEFGSAPANHMNVYRRRVVGQDGHWWSYTFDHRRTDWWSRPGLYQWSVFCPQTKQLIGYYVGKATSFSGRVPLYWTCMSPQIAEIYSGSRAIGARHNECVRDKSGLRWVHLWLARAFLQGHRVQLTVTRMDDSDDAERSHLESVWINEALAKEKPVLNHEALGERISRLDLCAHHLLNPPAVAGNGQLVYPKDWAPPFSQGDAARWMNAVTTWAHGWYAYRRHLGLKTTEIL